MKKVQWEQVYNPNKCELNYLLNSKLASYSRPRSCMLLEHSYQTSNIGQLYHSGPDCNHRRRYLFRSILFQSLNKYRGQLMELNGIRARVILRLFSSSVQSTLRLANLLVSVISIYSVLTCKSNIGASMYLTQ